MSSPIKAEPMTVIGLEVDSYKRLTAAELHPAATGLIPVKGRNAAGKSSLIGSMLEALGVERSKLPITEGQDGAQVVMDLGEIVVKVRWSRDSAGKAKRALTVEGKDGGKIKSPQATLDLLCGQFADPVAFLSMKPAEQVKVVLAVTGLDKDLDRLTDEAQEQYESRRDLGRDVERTSKLAAGLREAFTENPRLEKIICRDQDAPIETLMAELSAANERNSEIEETERTLAATVAQGEAASLEVEKTKKLLAAWEAEVVRLRDSWTSLTEERAKMFPVDVEPIKTKISGIEEVRDYRQASEQLAIAQQAADDDQAKYSAVDAALTSARERVAKLLGAATFPVAGMSYDHEAKALLINGIPFTQASQAEQLKVAATIAMAGDPAIRVIFAREGSLLDAESQRVLAEAAEASGFQLWLEIVSDAPDGDGSSGVWIEDGEAVDVGQGGE